MGMTCSIGSIHKKSSVALLALLNIIFLLCSCFLSPVASASSSGGKFQFGTSQALDLASVSVVRLVVSYSPLATASPVAGTTTPTSVANIQCTGLGVIVKSWATSNNADQNNWVLTDEVLVDPYQPICAQGPRVTDERLMRIDVYGNDAYTNNTLHPLLETFAYFSNTTNFRIATTSTGKGTMVLFPFHTYDLFIQPYMDVATANSTRSTGIELLNSTSDIPPQSRFDASQLFFTPVAIQATSTGISATRTEQGMPWVNTQGQLVGMNITNQPDITAAEIISFINQQPELNNPSLPHQNPLHDAWNKAPGDYYAKNYSEVQHDLANVDILNPAFQAATGLKQLAASHIGKRPAVPTRASPPPANNSIVIVSVLTSVILIVILVVVILIVVSRRRQRKHERPQFGGRPGAAEVQVARNAEEEEKRTQLVVQQVERDVLPFSSIVQQNTVVSVLPPTTSFCASCSHVLPEGASFCGNCGFQNMPNRSVEGITSVNASPSPVLINKPPALENLPVQPATVDFPSSAVSKVRRDEKEEEEQITNRVGQQFGNYQLLQLLGEGGFAEVYLGEHIHLGTHAAIKVLHSQLSQAEKENFRIEARTIVRLIHPHIVRVLDFGIEAKTPYLVMDYAPNGTLRNKYPKGTWLPVHTIVSYVKQVAEALQFAHNQKLIHRDVKPENMLLGEQQDVLLSDFGIAIVQQSSRYQNAQDMAGTIAYMAPEQIQSHPRFASDQYALGIVTYEWLCGHRPFQGSFAEVASKHMFTSPQSLREQVPDLPLAVEQVVFQALAKDPEDRFLTVHDFAQALEWASQQR